MPLPHYTENGMIQVRQLNFYYGRQHVLHDIDLHLTRGSITGLIGPNGVGKSTLMRCLAGLEVPSDGEVLLNGRPILEDPRASFAQLGYLPDIFGLSDDLTVIQYMTYAAKARGVPDNELESAVVDTVQLLGLEHKLYDHIKSLSRGQKQRVGIGQVIIHRPQFLLLDEPASGLDPEARYELSQLLLRLKSEGMTILVSSHILSELDEYCTHMLVMQRGRIKAHQAIHTENQNEQTLKIHLLQPPQDALARLRSLPNVQAASQQGDVFTVTLPQSDEMRAALLSDIVRAGLTLSSGSVVRTTLLENYQNSLNIHRENAQ